LKIPLIEAIEPIEALII